LVFTSILSLNLTADSEASEVAPIFSVSLIRWSRNITGPSSGPKSQRSTQTHTRSNLQTCGTTGICSAPRLPYLTTWKRSCSDVFGGETIAAFGQNGQTAKLGASTLFIL